MATYIDNIVKFHSFSKSPVSGNTTLGGAVNPSGHTITTSQVRAQDIPAFLNSFQGTKEQALTWIEANYATPAHNDIVYYGGEFKAGFSTPKCLKYVSKTVDENGKLVDLSAQECQWQDFDITSAATLKNADEKEVIAVHQNCQTVFVDGTNNASTNSNRWSLFVKKSDGTILDHFVASTDKIVAGQPSLGYNALVLYNNAAIDEGELDANYIGNTFAGIVHLNKQYNEGDDAKFKVTCFEYIGEKLDSEVARISAAVFGTGGEGTEDVSLTQKVAANTAAISVLNGDAQTTGSVAKAVADAEGRVTVTTNALADRIAQLEGIQHFSVVVVPEGETLPATPVENTIYLVKEEGVAEGTYIEYIAYKSGETVVTEKIGSTAIDLSGYTTDEEFAALASTEEGKEGRVTVLEGQVATLTGTAETEGSVAKALADAKDYTDTAIATELAEGGSIAQAIAEAKEQAIANAKVTLTAGNGITIPNSGTQDTAFTISVDTEVIATKASVEEVSDAVTGVSETVASLETTLSTGISEAKAAAQAAQTTADEAKATADTAVQSVTRAADSSDLITVTDGTDVTISLSTEVATKTYVGEQAAAAQAAAEQTAAGELSAAVEQIGKDIDSAIDAAKSEIKGTTDALDTRLTTAEGKVTTLEGQVAALTTGDNSVDSKIQAAVDAITETTDAISEAVEGVKNTADTAVQSASGDTYVSAAKDADSTNITVTTNIDAIASAVDTALVAEGTAVATAIADAAAAGTGAADALADTAISEQSVSGAGISVTLGGEVGAPTLTGSVTTASYADGVWTDGDKVATGSTVAAAIKDVDDKINTLHSTAVTFKVFETKPEASEELKGIIALVPAGEGDSAVAGSYIEWLCVESVADDGTKSYSWERIGTTAADFTQYAKTADLKVDETTVNGLTYSQTNGLVSASVAKASTTQVGTVQLTASYDAADSTNAATGTAIAAAIATLDTTAPVGEGAVKVSQTDGIVSSVTVETEALVSEDAIIDATTSTTALVTAADALEAIKLAKPDDYIATVKDGKGIATSGQVAALTIKDDRETVYENDLWGTSVTLDGNVLTVSHNKLSNPNTNNKAAWIEGITKVEGNKAYNGDTVVANIQTEMIKKGDYMFYATNLSEFSSDLSSLTDGGFMFNECSNLTSFTSGLSSLTNGHGMFSGCHKLESFSSDLSSLTNGISMFDGCSQLKSFSSNLSSLPNGISMFTKCENLTSFSSDLSSLTHSEEMFSYCSNLASFCGDLSSLTSGSNMFCDCSNLTSFNGDLSSLGGGRGMFATTKLDVESVECIADVIKSWGVYGEDGSLTGTSDEKVHHITIDVADTASTEIAKSIEEIAQKGWTVATNHTAFAATSAIDGNKPAATFMIAHPATEANATYVDAAGNFFTIETAVSVIGIGQSEWSIFASIEDAIAEWELTPYTKA